MFRKDIYLYKPVTTYIYTSIYIYIPLCTFIYLFIALNSSKFLYIYIAWGWGVWLPSLAPLCTPIYHTYIHLYLHTSAPLYLYTYILTDLCFTILAPLYSYRPLHHYTCTPTYRPMFQYSCTPAPPEAAASLGPVQPDPTGAQRSHQPGPRKASR